MNLVNILNSKITNKKPLTNQRKSQASQQPMNNPLENGQRIENQFIAKERPILKKYLKIWSISIMVRGFEIAEMQIFSMLDEVTLKTYMIWNWI